jgi:diaminopropionate ammonia-lyase
MENSAPRHPIYISPSASTYTFSPSNDPNTPSTNPSLVSAFHKSLPSFSPTPLIPLQPTPALLLNNLFFKSETSRLGLPAFKILGASWATYVTLCDHFGLPADINLTSLDVIARIARERGVYLFAATDGNFGRAIARMSKILNEAGVSPEERQVKVRAMIYVPSFTDEATIARIKSEGNDEIENDGIEQVSVIRTEGDYDAAVKEAAGYCKVMNDLIVETQGAADGAGKDLAVHIQDNAFEGYMTIPHHITDGYTTMLHEITSQLDEMGRKADFIVTPVGVGSLAHAVVKYAKAASDGRKIKVITVEPEAAACLNENLREGRHFTVHTRRTIMDGLCCGTVSPTAWPLLKEGVDVSVTVEEKECHDAVLELQNMGIDAGPCGAAVLAGLMRIWKDEGARKEIGLTEESVVVGIVTEGKREYVVPQ